MKSVISTRTLAVLAIGLLLIPEISNAASEFATFESFYRKSILTPWTIGAAIILAIIGGTAIFFTGGTATPIVASMGTSAGNLIGLSGAAATNAGLALFGGGSVAAGGLGMAGGAALLTAALSFSTTVVFDYGAGKAMEAYDYLKFVEHSKSMVTLPLPRNTSGSDSYEDALDILEDINQEETLFTNQNQAFIQKAIKIIGTANKTDLSSEEKSREQSLLALLYFTSNDYVAAKKYANGAYGLARSTNAKATFPAFIYATSSLYDEKPDFKRATDFFNYAIGNEPDNPLTPLLFAIYLDRIMYRFNDDALPYSVLDTIFVFSESLQSDQRKTIIRMGLQNRYFTALKIEQQKVLSLARTANKTIKDSPNTLTNVKTALSNYKLLRDSSKRALDRQTSAVAMNLNRNNGVLDKLRSRGIEEWEREAYQQLVTLNQLWQSYSDNVAELEGAVKELEAYQAELARTRLKKAKPVEIASTGGALDWWAYLLGAIAMLLFGTYLLRNRKTIFKS